MEKFAFFDFDGTLSKDFIWMKFLDYLHVEGIYPGDSYQKQMDAKKRYGSGNLSYDDWCGLCGKLWAEGLEGKKEVDISRYAEIFFKEDFKDNIYDESYKLTKLLKESGYKLVMVSMGPVEALSFAAGVLGIDLTYGTRLETVNGLYTGKLATDLHLPEGKKRLMFQFSREHSLSDSLGFGDSLSDRSMLEAVENPVALNPTEELRNLAKDRGWLIFSKDNVVEGLRNSPVLSRNRKVAM